MIRSSCCCKSDWISSTNPGFATPTADSKVPGFQHCGSVLPDPEIETQQSLLLGSSHHPMAVVGGIPTALKNMKVNWDHDIPNMMGKKKSCSKPPTSISLIYFSDIFWGYLFNLARFWTCLKLGVYPNLWQCLIEKMMINEKFNYNIITLVGWLQTTMYITK